MDEYEALLSEYKEALADVRLHSGLMFGELTVYLAASGVLLQIKSKGTLPCGAEVLGVILSLAFYVLHEGFGDFVHVARRRARELEKRLGFVLYSSSAYSDQIRHSFQSQTGHPFRLKSAKRSDAGAD